MTTTCIKRPLPKSKFDPASFRTGLEMPCKHGTCRVIFACPTGRWMPRSKKCRGGIEIYETITNVGGRRCPKGYKPKKGYTRDMRPRRRRARR